MIEGDGMAAQPAKVIENEATMGGQKPQPTCKLPESIGVSMFAVSEILSNGEPSPSSRKKVSATSSRKESLREEEMAPASPQKKKKIYDPDLEDPTVTCPSPSQAPALDPNLADLAARPPSPSPPLTLGLAPAPGATSTSPTISGPHKSHSSEKRPRWLKRQEKEEKKKEKKQEDHPEPEHPQALPPFKWPESNEEEHCAVDLEGQFHSFLLGCKEALVSQLLTDSFLVIDFMDLFAKDKDIALLICNEDRKWSESWLTPAVEKFATENGFAARKRSPHFINKPERIYAAKELLSQNELTVLKSVFRGARKKKILIATPHLQMLVAVILWGILGKFEKGISWQGKLTMDNLFFIKVSGRLELFILKDPAVKGTATPEDGLLDVKSVWPMVEPFVVSNDGALPLYFKQFRDDLANATAVEFNKPWFREYLKYSQALASSTERKDLIVDLQHISKTFKFSSKERHQLNIFMKLPPNGHTNWCSIVRDDEILQRTFHYKTNLMKKGIITNNPAMVVVVQKEKVTETKVVDPEVKQEENESISYNDLVSVMVQEKDPDAVVPDAFCNTTGSMLDFNRHSLTHTDEHISVTDLADVEIYGASKYEWFLPHVVKGFHKINQMKGSLLGTWSTYTAAIRGRLLCAFC